MSFPLIILLLKVRAPVYYIKYPRGSICYNQVKTLRRSCFDMKKKILKKGTKENEIYKYWGYKLISKENIINYQFNCENVYLFVGAGDIDFYIF